MAQIFLIGLGAGAASALLFASITSGNILAVFLFYLSALPLMLAAIAWSHIAGGLAVAVASLSLGLVLNFWIALIYLASVGVPAYVLAYMAMLGRPVAEGANGAPQIEWYPPGRLVIWAALIGAALVATVILQFGTSFETYQASVKTAFERILKIQARIPADQPLKIPGIDNPQRFLDTLTAIIPAAAAVLFMLTNLINLWLAGRVALMSGRLQRPWPELSAISFPTFAPALFAVAIGLSFMSGLPGFIAAVVVAVLTVAYAALGFAVLHTITRGVGPRIWLLAVTWIGVLVFGWPLIFIALLGIADSLFDLRGRVAARKPPFPPIQPK